MTPTERKALEFLATQDGVVGIQPRQLAHHLWPDSPAWKRRGQRHDGRNAANGAALWLSAGRILHRLDSKGWAAQWPDYVVPGIYNWEITQKGREALAEVQS